MLIAVFVYGLIGWNVKVSFSDWRQAQQTSGFCTAAYSELFHRHRPGLGRERSSTYSLFTGAFMVGTLLLGAVLALLLDKGVKGEGFFRAVYLFPMAVSFIAAGVVWRWLMNPAPGRPRRPG